MSATRKVNLPSYGGNIFVEIPSNLPLPAGVVRRDQPEEIETIGGIGRVVHVTVPVTVVESGFDLDFHFRLTSAGVCVMFQFFVPGIRDRYQVWDIRHINELTPQIMIKFAFSGVFG
jgi:hypothetical protein